MGSRWGWGGGGRVGGEGGVLNLAWTPRLPRLAHKNSYKEVGEVEIYIYIYIYVYIYIYIYIYIYTHTHTR